MYEGSTKGIWHDLKKRFAVGRALILQQDMTIISCYTKLKAMWDELSRDSKVPSCSCGG